MSTEWEQRIQQVMLLRESGPSEELVVNNPEGASLLLEVQHGHNSRTYKEYFFLIIQCKHCERENIEKMVITHQEAMEKGAAAVFSEAVNEAIKKARCANCEELLRPICVAEGFAVKETHIPGYMWNM